MKVMGSSHQHTSKRAWSGAAVLMAGAAVLMAGCGPAASGASANPPTPSTPPSTSSAASSPPIPCGAVTSLRATLTNLTHIKPGADNSGELGADLSSIKTQLDALKTWAAAYAAQSRPLNQAIDRVSLAASAAASHPSGATIAALAAALGGLGAAVQPVIAEANAACPSP
jgi:hypothetical protein